MATLVVWQVQVRECDGSAEQQVAVEAAGRGTVEGQLGEDTCVKAPRGAGGNDAPQDEIHEVAQEGGANPERERKEAARATPQEMPFMKKKELQQIVANLY